MYRLLLIIKREFLAKVRSKSYLVLIFLSPVLMLGMFAAVFYFANKQTSESDKKTSIILVANKEISDEMVSKHSDIVFQKASYISFDDAKYLMNEQGMDGVIYTNTTLDALEIYGNDKIPYASLTNILNKYWRIKLLNEHHISSQIIDQITKKAPVYVTKVNTSKAEIKQWVQATIAIGSGYLVMMFLIIYGNSVMRSIIEEKNSRVIEIMICTVKPFQLMMGKIIGNALAGILQFLIWGVLLFLGLWLLENYFPITKDSPYDVAHIFRVIWSINYVEIFIVFILFFVSGYLLYSGFYAAVGAAVNSETDTQQFVHPILLPLMFAVYIGIVTVVNGNPNGQTAVLFSFIPFTSPIVMLMRIPFGVPTWHIVLSLALLLVSFVTAVLMASKIYRIGILTYGNKPNIKQILRWVFQKQ